MKSKLICILVFTLLVTTSLSATGSERGSSELTIVDESSCNPFFTNVLARIDTTDEDVLIPRGVEIAGGRPGEWIDIIIPWIRLNELSNSNIDYSVLIWDVDAYSQTVAGQYHTLAEIENILQNIANNYPNITSLYSIGTTYEGRDIWCLEITDNPGVDEGEPGIFFMGLHHAREWPTVEICLHIADELTSKYGSDPDITDVVNNRRLWLVTCVNPDGYYYCHDLGNDWRKNRNYFPEFGTYGVDNNRNYGGSSNGDPWGAWGSIGPGSVTHNSDYSTYCGPRPESELETQAIRDVFLQNNICATITWHTHGQLVMWPWSYTPSSAPDVTYMSQVGQQIASRITRQSGSGTYTPQQSCTLYGTTGDTTDWAYGYSHYIQGRTTFAYTIEACSSYHPSASYLDQICAENFDGALYLLEEAENIRDTVVPRVIPPVIDEMTTDPDGNYTISWEEQNPDAEPDYFQLDELTDISLVTDDAESGSDSWTLDGFSLSTSRSHSSSHSYKSRHNHEDVSSMTTVTPLPVTSGMKLSFWCWYNIELEWDYAIVEVSRDGRYYEILDTFTGSSGGWSYEEYTLDDYIGESIFVRFRYTTDQNTQEEGFYVDDISPLADFVSITTLSNTIMDPYYEVNGKSEGTYYYRVKGYNAEHGWGDFSTLEDMEVSIIENDPPNIPNITGPTSGNIGTAYDYTFVTTDPNGDNISYYIEWGDGSIEEWVGLYVSGEEVILNHTWDEKGPYVIRAKAKDVFDEESNWGTLEVTMPRNKILVNSLFLKFLERFPRAFPILRNLLGL
ncbi:MAG: immune inhibitor A [Thermoplasmatales archaeon]|nr:immune inhibitor A [Thermoplasmatales archaeon]